MTNSSTAVAAQPAKPGDGPHAEAWAAPWTVLAIVLAGLGGGLFTLAGWAVMRQINLPAFNTSMVTRALAGAGTVAVVALTVFLIALWMRDRDATTPRPRWRHWLTLAIGYLSPAGLVLASTALPLSATRLYIDGLQSDQPFRTQFLTRMAQTPHLVDMNYWDLPSYYPAAWFWAGGRLANLLGIPGWEVYQPWALVSLAAAGSMLVPVWQRISGSLPKGVAIALVSTAVVVVMTPDEPYAAVIALGSTAAVVLALRGARGSWFASWGLAVFLGVSASMYTLFTAIIAAAVVVMSLVVAGLRRSLKPLGHLLVTGLAAIAIALVVWGPYLMAELRGGFESGAAATHYLPNEGTRLPMPFFNLSMLGLLCLVGLVYLFIGFRDRTIQALACATACFYAWILLSMLVTLLGTTLLGFRAEVLVAVVLATSGVFGFAHARSFGVERLYPDRVGPNARRTISAILACLLGLGGLGFAQQIPYYNEEHIDLAYVDTDGYGERGDRFAPDVAQYYADIDSYLQETGHPPEDTVVLTDEIRFMSYYPYFGFQAFTSHYANPLGDYEERNDAIARWAEASWDEAATADDFLEMIEDAPWRAPDAFIMRGELAEETEEGFKLHLVEDIYPNQPNVRYSAVFFNPDVFREPAWQLTQIGPFVVGVRA